LGNQAAMSGGLDVPDPGRRHAIELRLAAPRSIGYCLPVDRDLAPAPGAQAALRLGARVVAPPSAASSR